MWLLLYLGLGWKVSMLSFYTFCKFFKCTGKTFNWCNRLNVIYVTFSFPAIRWHYYYCISFMILMIWWSTKYLGWKAFALWFLINTSCPFLRFLVLLYFLSVSGSVCHDSLSNLACLFHMFLSSCTANLPGCSATYLQ